MENTETVQYFETGFKKLDSKKFEFSLQDIQLDNISDGVKDEYLRDAIINPTILEEKYDEEKQAILNDLALLENTSEIREFFPSNSIANQ